MTRSANAWCTQTQGDSVFDNISILRLLHFADECRRASAHAFDPLTKRELAEIEQKFRDLAADVEAAQDKNRAPC